MYTEDDEKYSYKSSKNKKNSEKENPYEINNYTNDNEGYLNYDMYNTDYHDDEELEKEKSNRKIDKKRLLKLTIIAILVFILSILIYFIINTSTVNPRIELINETISLKAGESGAIAYEIVDTELRIPVAFVSNNEEIVTVDENGMIYGKSRGNTYILLIYYVDNVRHEEKCEVIVN